VPPRLTLGLGNEYFCRSHPLKKAKIEKSEENILCNFNNQPLAINFGGKICEIKPFMSP
jgi:hypothetical protein